MKIEFTIEELTLLYRALAGAIDDRDGPRDVVPYELLLRRITEQRARERIDEADAQEPPNCFEPLFLP